MTTLYHFTCVGHLKTIMDEGLIRRTESNIGSPSPDIEPYGEHYAPDVVWAFDIPDPDLGQPEMLNGLLHQNHNKQLVRITFDVPGPIAFPWDAWSKEQGINPHWKEVLERIGPPEHWVVVLQPVPRSQWKLVEYRESIEAPWNEVRAIRYESEVW